MDTKKTCYLFFDYDGTVYTHHTFAPENVYAMREAQKSGHKLIINTGRARGAFPAEDSRAAGIIWDGAVFGGADIEFDGVRFPTTVIPARDGLKWMRFAKKNRIKITFQGECTMVKFDMRETDEKLSRTEKKKLIKELKAFLKQDRLTKMTLIEFTPEMAKRIPKNTGELLWNGTYAELYQTGMDKGTAILRFCELTGAELSQCVCFGDSMNDEAMFRTAPASVAMKKSPDAIKSIATFVAATETGVAEGLERLFGIKYPEPQTAEKDTEN